MNTDMIPFAETLSVFALNDVLKEGQFSKRLPSANFGGWEGAASWEKSRAHGGVSALISGAWALSKWLVGCDILTWPQRLFRPIRSPFLRRQSQPQKLR
jgi:hypothetical protein